MSFIDELRKTTNESDADDQLINKCIDIVEQYAPNVFTTIPNEIQDKLMDAARQKKHVYIFSHYDHFRFIKTYSKIDFETSTQIRKIVQKAKYNSLFTIRNNDYHVILNWKYLDNECEFEFTKYNDLSLVIKLGQKTAVKILEKAGFKVYVNSIKQTIKVKW